MKKILLFFLVFTTVNFLTILLAAVFIPYLGFFPFKELALQYHLPFYLTNLANFDGEHYLLIAKEGYLTYNQAFFPLYPLLIKYLSPVFLENSLLTAIIISNLATVFGLYVFDQYRRNFTKITSSLPLLFFLLFPTSFFLTAVYTEGLFFFLFLSSLIFFYKKRYALAFILGILTALTRLSGLFLIIPYTVTIFYMWKKKEIDKGSIINLFSPLIGFFLYAFYLLKTTGDPLFFFHAQPAFGANRSTNFIVLPQVLFRYIKIFITSTWNFQYFTALCEFVIFLFVLGALCYQFFMLIKQQESKEKYTMLGLNLFSIVIILLPSATGTLSSMPRYALFSFSLFFLLSSIKNKFFLIFLGVIFFVLHVALLGFFVQGYFVG